MDAQLIAASRRVGSAGVFSRVADGENLKLQYKKGVFTDEHTGSEWNLLGLGLPALARASVFDRLTTATSTLSRGSP